MAISSITDNLAANEAKVASALAAGVSAIFRKIAPAGGKAILFGSRARGDARRESDWDVLVLLDKDKITAQDEDEVSYPIREIGWQMDEMVNPIMYTVRDWEKKRHTPFYRNVLREGVVL